MRMIKSRKTAESVTLLTRKDPNGQGMGTVENLRVLRAMGKLVRERRAELAKDRAGFASSLIRNFTSLGDVLTDASNFMLTENGSVLPELVTEFGDLFAIWNFAIFQPLADNLTYDEEDGLRTAMRKVREGWRLFLGVCRLKFPDITDELMQGEELAIDCTDFVEDFFLGEIETELTDDYNAKSASLDLFLENLKGRFE